MRVEYDYMYLEELRPFFNDIGLLYDTEVVRLIGYAQSPVDCYYITQKRHFTGEKYDGICYSSMVGSFVSLKGIYPRYEQLEHMFTNVWNCPPVSEAIIKEIEED